MRAPGQAFGWCARRVGRAQAAGVLALVGALGCGGGGASPETESRPERRIASALPVGRPGPTIEALPSHATYAWVEASRLFLHVDAQDDQWSLGSRSEEVREHLSAAIRAHGWRLASPDSAQYLLTAVYARRTRENFAYVDDPRNLEVQSSQCAHLPQAQRSTCMEPPPPRYPPRRERRPPVWHVYLGFAIARAEDGATRWWVFGAPQRNEIVRRTIELLAAGDRE